MTKNRLYIILFGLNFLYSFNFFGQKINTKLSKTEYKIDEEIVVVFETKAQVGEIAPLYLQDFNIIQGPPTKAQ